MQRTDNPPANSPGPSPAGNTSPLQAALHAHKTRIGAAIAAYPAPIPACDVQFNTLLAQQSLVNAALRALATVRDPEALTEHPAWQALLADPELASQLR